MLRKKHLLNKVNAYYSYKPYIFLYLFKQWNKAFEFFLSPTPPFFVFRQDRMSEAYFILHVGIEKTDFWVHVNI